MSKIITFVPKADVTKTKRILEALKECSGIEEYLLLVRINPEDRKILALLKRIQFVKIQIDIASRTFSAGHNSQILWRKAFNQASFIVHLSSDMMPKRGCLRYMEHCNRMYRDDQEIFSIASYNQSRVDPGDSNTVFRRDGFSGGIFGFWKERWITARSECADNVNNYETSFAHIAAKRRLKEIYPLLSRSTKTTSRVTSVPDQPKRSDKEAELPGFVEFRDLIPLVTAVMITGMHKTRYSLARVAIDCFKRQTYPNKEMLIVNHGEDSLFDGDARICELRIKKRDSATVGDLRNLALKHAAGQYIINWDDDDWYHPDRMLVQMRAQTGDAAVLLKNRIAFNFENGCALYLICPAGSHATILHPRDINYRYPSLLRRSDSAFSECFESRITLDNDPALYIRFHHGMNLWSAKHIMLHLADPKIKNRLEVTGEHRRLLKTVLARYPCPAR